MYKVHLNENITNNGSITPYLRDNIEYGPVYFDYTCRGQI